MKNRWCDIGGPGCTGDAYCQSMSRSRTYCRNCYASGGGVDEYQRWLQDPAYRAAADFSAAAVGRSAVADYVAGKGKARS